MNEKKPEYRNKRFKVRVAGNGQEDEKKLPHVRHGGMHPVRICDILSLEQDQAPVYLKNVGILNTSFPRCSIEAPIARGNLMRHSVLPFITCVVMTFTGCGPNLGNSQQPGPSDSTEELAALLAQRDEQHPAMLLPRKISAIEILSTRGDEALPTLFGLAQDVNEEKTVRFIAIEAIGKFHQIPEDQIPALFALRRSENGILVNDPLERSCKAASKEVVVPLLVEFVKNDGIDYEARQFVALILLDIDEPAAASAGVVKGVNEYLPNEKFMPDIRKTVEGVPAATQPE